MKKLCIFLILMIFILGGCSSKYIEFSGGSTNWDGKYSTTIINGNEEDGSYTFFYKKGDGDTILKNTEIIINNGGKETIQKDEEHKGANFIISSSCQGCSVTRENESIKVTIKWDGKYEESFFLEQK